MNSQYQLADILIKALDKGPREILEQVGINRYI
jgi:hypothetical protein